MREKWSKMMSKVPADLGPARVEFQKQLLVLVLEHAVLVGKPGKIAKEHMATSGARGCCVVLCCVVLCCVVLCRVFVRVHPVDSKLFNLMCGTRHHHTSQNPPKMLREATATCACAGACVCVCVCRCVRVG